MFFFDPYSIAARVLADQQVREQARSALYRTYLAQHDQLQREGYSTFPLMTRVEFDLQLDQTEALRRAVANRV